LVEALMTNDAAAVAKVVIRAAKKGDLVACKIVLDRVAPPRRGRAVTFELPDITNPGGLMAASAALLRAVAAGEMTPDEAEPISAMLASHLKVVEATDIAARIAELERRTGVRK
jgi:N-acetylglucosamine kinase-like BadF-type ATPase